MSVTAESRPAGQSRTAHEKFFELPGSSIHRVSSASDASSVDVARDLDIARGLAQAGVPIFVARANAQSPIGFDLPKGWQQTLPSDAERQLAQWRPGDAVCAVGGVAADFLDVDPRNRGDDSATALKAGGIWPRSYGTAATPSGGTHDIIAPLRVGKGEPAPGVDLQGGRDDGTGRGFVFIAPTVRRSKVDGQMRPYRWLMEPNLDAIDEGDDTGGHVAALVRTRGTKASTPSVATTPSAPPAASVLERLHQFRDELRDWPADRGGANHRAASLAFMAGQYVGAEQVSEQGAIDILASGMDGWTTWKERGGRAKMLDTITRQVSIGKASRRAWAEEPPMTGGSISVPAELFNRPPAAPPFAPPSAAETPPATSRPVPLDWAEEFEADYSKVEWLPGQLCQRGEQISVVGEGKAGKSLFLLDWAWHAVTGANFLGTRNLEPITVLYADRENSKRDLIQRLRTLGATPEQLSRLVYYSFPPVRHLDQTGTDLLELVAEHNADAVVLDTVSRFVQGKENDSDTWLNLYRNVHVRLKADGRAGIRIDHFGKDTDRGSRGSSAKSQDIDHVWELTKSSEDRSGTTTTTKLRLKRTHTRSGIGPDVIDFDRTAVKDERGELWLPGQTRHGLSLEPPKVWSGVGVQDIARRLDEAGVERFAGREKCKEAGHKLGIKQSNEMWAHVVRFRKEQHGADLSAARIGNPWAVSDSE